jgi:hypothetical protein
MVVNGTREHEHGRRHPLVCCYIWFKLVSYELLVSANGAHQPLFHGFVALFNDFLSGYSRFRVDICFFFILEIHAVKRRSSTTPTTNFKPVRVLAELTAALLTIFLSHVMMVGIT